MHRKPIIGIIGAGTASDEGLMQTIGLKLGKAVVQLSSWPQVEAGLQVKSAKQAIDILFNLLEGGSDHAK